MRLIAVLIAQCGFRISQTEDCSTRWFRLNSVHVALPQDKFIFVVLSGFEKRLITLFGSSKLEAASFFSG